MSFHAFFSRKWHGRYLKLLQYYRIIFESFCVIFHQELHGKSYCAIRGSKLV
jgi:hypothetical protein